MRKAVEAGSRPGGPAASRGASTPQASSSPGGTWHGRREHRSSSAARSTALADRWRHGWQGSGFEPCCTPDVSYEDPVAVEPLRGVDALDRHAATLRGGVSRPARRGHGPAAGRAATHACVPWRATGTHRGDLGRPCRPPIASLTLHGLHYLELIRRRRAPRARLLRPLRRGHAARACCRRAAALGETALLMLRGFGLRRRPT